MFRVVADTNIYVSALNFGGTPDEALSSARRGHVQLFISKPILDEIDAVLQRKFAWTLLRVHEALTEIQKFATLVNPDEKVTVVTDDEPDNRILECALAAEAHFVVSGDSHLKELERYGDILILSPRAFLDSIAGIV